MNRAAQRLKLVRKDSQSEVRSLSRSSYDNSQRSKTITLETFKGVRYLKKGNQKKYQEKRLTCNDVSGSNYAFRLFKDADLGFDLKVQGLIETMQFDQDVASDDQQIGKAKRIGVQDLKKALKQQRQSRQKSKQQDTKPRTRYRHRKANYSKHASSTTEDTCEFSPDQ